MILILAAFGWTGSTSGCTVRGGPHTFATMPTGGFSPEPRSVEPFAAGDPVGDRSSSWCSPAPTSRSSTGRSSAGTRSRSSATRSSGSTSCSCSLALRVLIVELWDAGISDGRGGGPSGGLPDGLDHDDDRVREHRLRRLAVVAPAAAMRSWPSCSWARSAGSTAGRSRSSATSSSAGSCAGSSTRRSTPSTSRPIRLNRVSIDERTVRAVIAFVLLYVGIFVAGALLLLLDAQRAASSSRRPSTRSGPRRPRSVTSARPSASRGRSAPSSRSATSRSGS